jgi:uncharacterized protein YuzE
VRITYDPEYDILYMKIGKAAKVLSKDVDEDITLDLDTHGKLVGIEVLSASDHLDLRSLLPVEVKQKTASGELVDFT